jgi:hypothetical protein
MAKYQAMHGDKFVTAVGLCTLHSFDPYPITNSLSNP